MLKILISILPLLSLIIAQTRPKDTNEENSELVPIAELPQSCKETNPGI